jgi:hypothetical protein
MKKRRDQGGNRQADVPSGLSLTPPRETKKGGGGVNRKGMDKKERGKWK